MEGYDAKVSHIRTDIENTSACCEGPVDNHYCVLVQEERVTIYHYVPGTTSTMYKHSIADNIYQFITMLIRNIRLIQSNEGSRTKSRISYMSSITNKDILICL